MRSITQMRPLLGTFVEVGARGHTGQAEAAVRSAFARIALVQRLLSFQDPDSELSRLNRAGGAGMALHPVAWRVLRLARAMTRASDGLFNCTVGGKLVRLGALPDHGDGHMLDAGDAGDIECGAGAVRLKRPVRLTLDGIAKGYAVDLAIDAMRRAGAQAGWVNAGGDLRVFGALTLAVQRREADGRRTMLGGVREAAIASSRVDSRYDADFPALVVSATAGGLAEAGMWSVLARRAWRADALTKVAALAPVATRDARIRRLGGRMVRALRLEDAAA